jgi:LmbE family N-acetylglucosaminyl deacetylase/membrane-associated phospholipid phosphatase
MSTLGVDTPSPTARRPALAGELAVLVGLLVVYDRVRRLAPIHVSAAVRHGVDVLRFEGPLRVEQTINRWFAAHGTLDVLAVGYYQFLHIGAALTVLGWCYVRRPEIYRPARTALVGINAVGLIAFAVYPVAPPRLLPGSAYIDLVARAGFGTSHGPIPMDAYAAMPSLHVAWAVGVAIVGLTISDRTFARAVFLLHPVLTAVAVVGTGNHYLLDIAAGGALGGAATLVAGLPWRRRHVGLTPARASDGERFTLVAFHAHPDDETLFTGGTLARAAAEGHRVVVVVATLGEAGLADSGGGDLGARRRVELAAAAAELGVHRWEWLGYTDSGRFGEASGVGAFARAEPEQAAERLAAILGEERADVLTTYDSVGGYGHPDHVQVHDVGARAAFLAAVPVLEATVDRGAALRAAHLLRVVPRLPRELRPASVSRAFVRSEHVTHRIDVAPFADRKRAAMRAHVSQRSGGSELRSLALYLHLPAPIFRKVYGTEWFVEPGRMPGRPPLDDVFATVRRGLGAARQQEQRAVPPGCPEQV